MATPPTPRAIDIAITSVENILRNPRPFATAEIITEIRSLFSLLDDILKNLPQDQQFYLNSVREAMTATDRKRLLRTLPDTINICKDAWQAARLQYYNEVKRYLKFIHENRRTPTLEECRALKLEPSKLAQYQVDLDRFLREGESPEDLGPIGAGDQPEDREDKIASAGERVIAEWGQVKRPITIPNLVIEGGYSFVDSLAIARWIADHGSALDNSLDSQLADTIARSTSQARKSHQCPVCGHSLPPFSTEDSSVICEECGFEINKGE